MRLVVVVVCTVIYIIIISGSATVWRACIIVRRLQCIFSCSFVSPREHIHNTCRGNEASGRPKVLRARAGASGRGGTSIGGVRGRKRSPGDRRGRVRTGAGRPARSATSRRATWRGPFREDTRGDDWATAAAATAAAATTEFPVPAPPPRWAWSRRRAAFQPPARGPVEPEDPPSTPRGRGPPYRDIGGVAQSSRALPTHQQQRRRRWRDGGGSTPCPLEVRTRVTHAIFSPPFSARESYPHVYY